MILVSSFIASKVDYCNVVLAGLPQRALDRVQSVVNAAARLSADAREYDHVTPLLMNLPWLRLPERVKFKLCMCAHAPLPYWSGAEIFDRAGSACRQYCSSSPALGVILLILLCLSLAVQPSVTVRSLLPVHERGTAYHLTFEHLHNHSTRLINI